VTRTAIVVLAAWSLTSALVGCATNPPGLARGREVYDTCVPCHGANGGGNHELGAPAIAGLPQWYVETQLTNFQKGMRGNHPDDLEGARMRPMAKTLHRKGDVESVAEYVARLPVVTQPATLGGDPVAGEAAFALCATCHGTDAKGIKDMGAPTLAGQSDWYMYAQLQKFKNGMRGAHPEDAMGAQMAAMSQTLADTTAMLDVVSYVRKLTR
jgi:cytochrome c oxidase subunit 2